MCLNTAEAVDIGTNNKKTHMLLNITSQYRRSGRHRYQQMVKTTSKTACLNTAEAVDIGTNLIFSFLSKFGETASNTNDSFPMVNIDDSPFSQM